jgi:hypothetical protein
VSGRRLIFWVPILVTALAIAYVAIHFSAQNSDGYRFLEERARQSMTIQQRVGAIASIRLSWIAGYRSKTVGSKEWAVMTLHIVGSKGSVDFRAIARKSETGVWALSDTSLDGIPTDLRLPR